MVAVISWFAISENKHSSGLCIAIYVQHSCDPILLAPHESAHSRLIMHVAERVMGTRNLSVGE